MLTTESTSEGNKEKKKFKNKYGALMYSNFIKVSLLLYLLAFLLFSEDEFPFFDFTKSAIGFIIASIIIVILYSIRRIIIGYMVIFELDARTSYELDKRALPFYKDYNNKLLYCAHFFEGDFLKTISLCDESLERTKSKKYTLLARHTKILSLFFSEGTQNIKELIQEQREFKATVKSKDFDYMFRVYQFMEAYLDGDYEKAMETVLTFLSDEKESVYNSRKIVFMQFQKMLCLKNGDTEAVQNCNLEILKCDSERRTFFSKIIVS